MDDAPVVVPKGWSSATATSELSPVGDQMSTTHHHKITDLIILDPSTGCWTGYTLGSAPRTTMTLSFEDRNKDMLEFQNSKHLVSCNESISTPTTMIVLNVWIRVYKFRIVSSNNCIVLLHWVAKSTLIVNMKTFALYPIVGVSWLAQEKRHDCNPESQNSLPKANNSHILTCLSPCLCRFPTSVGKS